MREIEGFVCTVELTQSGGVAEGEPAKLELLYGPNVNQFSLPAERFVTNGLVPFASFEEAGMILEELVRSLNNRNVTASGLARVKLAVTESDLEIPQLNSDLSFVIVANFEGGRTELFGATTESTPLTAGVLLANLEENGFLPVTGVDVPVASYGGPLYEVRRQWLPKSANLATFVLERLSYPAAIADKSA